MNFWKQAFVFSAYMKDLDGTGVLGAVRCPKDIESDGTIDGDSISALNVALNQQRIKDGRTPTVHELPEGENEYVSPDSRLLFIPRLGYLAVNRTEVGVECNDGEKRTAVKATRKLRSKTSSFYLFRTDVNDVYSGSLGRMQFRLSKTAVKDTWHLQIISY